MKVIIGTGQLGLSIMDMLLRSNPNETILLVNRSGKLSCDLPQNVHVMAADATDKHEMECIAREADIIYSCTDVPYQHWEHFYPAIASALAYVLNKTNTRLVFADNMYSYGNLKGAKMTETLPHIAQTKKGKIRASVLFTLLTSGNQLNNRVAIVKAADFIGPRIHKGIFGTDFLDRLYKGKNISQFGNPCLPHTFTFIEDFARAMINVGNAPDAFGQIWHVPNAPAISVNDWIALFEKESGKKAKTIKVPKALIRIAGLFNVLVRELYELAYQFDYPYLVIHDKYVNRFGDHFTNHEDIVTDTVKWYEKHNRQHY